MNKNHINLIFIGLMIFCVAMTLIYDKRTDPLTQNDKDHHPARNISSSIDRNTVKSIHSKFGKTIDENLAKETPDNLEQILSSIIKLANINAAYGKPTRTEKTLAAFYWMNIEINNGGMHQYFFNSAGDSWELILQLLQEIDNKEGLKRFTELTHKFPGGKPSSDRQERWKQLEELEKQRDIFDAATKEYYEKGFFYQEELLKWIKKNKNEIQTIDL